MTTSKWEGDWMVVAAIDLGTTFSGYAFSFRSDFQTNPLKIFTNDWTAEGVHNAELKAPSVVLLNPDRTFNSFGYRAQSTYADLLDEPENAAKYYFLQHFKMQLHNREISLDMTIQDITGKDVPAIIVFTETIRYLKDHFLEKFNERRLDFTIKDMFFVITVPAIWSDAAKQFMRQASEKAGIGSNQMILAYEPEAAALLCSLLPEDQGIAKYFQERRRLMIVDLGGGTADITVVKVIKRTERLTYIEHVYRVTGGAWGGNQVNNNYEKFLGNVFGNDVMEAFKKNNLNSYIDMMKDFEIQKKTLSAAGERQTVRVKIAGEIISLFKSIRGKDLKQELAEKLDGKVTIVGDKLKFEVSIFKRFFQDCVSQIIGHINETFMERGCAWPSAMILVGGFSDSPVIREAIRDAFPVIKDIVSPVGSSLSVLKGSVIFGHEPNIVTGRVCQETLGVSLYRTYAPDDATKQRTFKIDGELRANKSFEKMFSINEIIKVGQKRTLEFQDLHSHLSLRKEPKIFEVYSSQEEDPKYITDIGCHLKGRIIVYPPTGEWPETAEGFIDMETGGTEIIVRYRDKISGHVTEEKIDFM